jgi:ribosomal subunit interface protein
MQRPLIVSFHNLQHSEAVETKVREYVTKLERYCDHIIGCHVTIDMPHRSSEIGNPYQVKISLLVPEHEIVVNHQSSELQTHEDVYAALKDAFDKAKRQLQDYGKLHVI